MIRKIVLSTIAVSVMVVINGCCVDRGCSPDLTCDTNDLMPSIGTPSYLSPNQDACIDETDCAPIDISMSPIDVDDYSTLTYQDLTLLECINNALINSKVFRDLGGGILRTPESMQDVYGPASTYTDPQFSEDAALAAFDANFVSSAFFSNNDTPSNLAFQGDNGRLVQDLDQFQVGFEKLAATGTFFALRNGITYDNNNQTGQILPHSWESVLEGEFRHPLLQGGGTTFNRIAGPSNQAGVYNGVLIARTNTEIDIAEFSAGVRDLISDVENAYWDLYFAYRNLEANVDGRNNAYKIFAESEANQRDSSQATAQAKEQYLRFEASVLDAMEGRPTSATRNNNGTSSGVFQSVGGVRVAERRLRLITGLPINGAQLLKPSDEPANIGVKFDWHQCVEDGFVNRQEVRQQRWLIKRKELELMASKNFLQPRLDIIGQYRLRGLGQDLMGSKTTFNQHSAVNTSSAFGDLFGRDFQEWQVGAELSIPIGYRRGNLGVRHAELALMRERAVLHEQKREVVYGLSNAVAELRRSHASLKATQERYIAAREFQKVMSIEVKRGRDRDIELEAQRRVVESEIQYRRAQVEYMLAIKNVHFEKGTYLDYCNVRLAESTSEVRSGADFEHRQSKNGRPLNYISHDPFIGKTRSENATEIEVEPTVTPVENSYYSLQEQLTPNSVTVPVSPANAFSPAPLSPSVTPSIKPSDIQNPFNSTRTSRLPPISVPIRAPESTGIVPPNFDTKLPAMKMLSPQSQSTPRNNSRRRVETAAKPPVKTPPVVEVAKNNIVPIVSAKSMSQRPVTSGKATTKFKNSVIPKRSEKSANLKSARASESIKTSTESSQKPVGVKSSKQPDFSTKPTAKQAVKQTSFTTTLKPPTSRRRKTNKPTVEPKTDKHQTNKAQPETPGLSSKPMLKALPKQTATIGATVKNTASPAKSSQ